MKRKKFAKAVKIARLNKKLTQKELAKASKISQGAVSQVEKTKTKKIPLATTFLNICKSLKLNPNKFLT